LSGRSSGDPPTQVRSNLRKRFLIVLPRSFWGNDEMQTRLPLESWLPPAKPRVGSRGFRFAPASLPGARFHELLDPQRDSRVDLGRPVGGDIAGASTTTLSSVPLAASVPAAVGTGPLRKPASNLVNPSDAASPTPTPARPSCNPCRRTIHIANGLRVIDFVLLWAHDGFVVYPLSFLSRVTWFIANEKSRSRSFSREVARKKARGVQPR